MSYLLDNNLKLVPKIAVSLFKPAKSFSSLAIVSFISAFLASNSVAFFLAAADSVSQVDNLAFVSSINRCGTQDDNATKAVQIIKNFIFIFVILSNKNKCITSQNATSKLYLLTKGIC